MFSQPLLLDGGLSTALEELGCNLNSTLWSGALVKTAPEQIRSAHKAFAEAGADIIISSSYQLSFPGASAQGWSHQEVEAALRKSTELARFPGKLVAASVGPYGAFLADGSEYRGNYGLTKEELKDFHRERLKILIDSKPDFLAIETIPEITEAAALIELLGEVESKVPAWVSFSCKSSTQISSGEFFSDAVRAVTTSNHVSAVGINCTSPDLVSDLLNSALSSIPFVVYPNAGRKWDAEAKQWQGSVEFGFSEEMVHHWKSLGVKVVGGCCGVGPSQISKLEPLVRA